MNLLADERVHALIFDLQTCKSMEDDVIGSLK